MKCHNIRFKLIEYYENTLLPEENKAIQEHLDACSKCQKEFQEIKSTFELLKEESPYQTDEFYWTNFVSGVRSRIEKQTNTTVVLIPKWKIAGSLTTFLLILILGIFLFSKDQKVIFGTGEETFTYLIPTDNESLEQLLYTEEELGSSLAFLFTDSEKEKFTMLDEELEKDYWERAGKEEAFEELSLEELENLKKNLEKTTLEKEIL